MNPLRTVLTALKLAPRRDSPGDSDSVDIELPGLVERENFDSTDYDVRSLGEPIDPVTESRIFHRPR